MNKGRKVNLFQTFTKLWVTLLLIIAVVDLQLSYILAFIGRETIAESLSIAVVTEIIGVICVYMIRAFFDTASEKKHELEVEKLNNPITQDCVNDTVDDNSDVEG